MVDLVRAGRDPEELAHEFEPTSQSIRNWVAQVDRHEGRREEKSETLGAAERVLMSFPFARTLQARVLARPALLNHRIRGHVAFSASSSYGAV
jgi:hypothetical protein